MNGFGRYKKVKYIAKSRYCYCGSFIICRNPLGLGEFKWEVTNYEGESVTHGKTINAAVANLERVLEREPNPIRGGVYA